MNNNKQNEYTNSYDVTVNLKDIKNKHNLGLLLGETFGDDSITANEYDFEGYEEFVFEAKLPQKDIVKKMEEVAKKINKNISYTLIDEQNDIEHKTAIEPSNVWTEDDKNKVASLATKFFKYMYEKHFDDFQQELIDSEVPSFLKEQLNDENTFGLLIDSITDYGRDESDSEEEDDEQSETEGDEEDDSGDDEQSETEDDEEDDSGDDEKSETEDEEEEQDSEKDEVKDRDDIDKLLLFIHPGARITEKAKCKITKLLHSLEDAWDADNIKNYLSDLPKDLQKELALRGSVAVMEKGTRLIFKPKTWVKTEDLYCTGVIQEIGSMLLNYSGNSTEETRENMIIKDKNIDLVLDEYTELKKLFMERIKIKYLGSLTKQKLKDLCKQHNCKVSGTKKQLITRLFESDSFSVPI